MHVFSSLYGCKLKKIHHFRLINSVTFVSRHQKNGAVIARCSQPEISWWGWRNTDDEYLVTSIAKACQMDSGTKGAQTNRQRGEATDSSDGDFGNLAV